MSRQQGKAEFSDFIGELDSGEYKLVAFKRDGICWTRCGEFPVTNRLRVDMNQNPILLDGPVMQGRNA